MIQINKLTPLFREVEKYCIKFCNHKFPGPKIKYTLLFDKTCPCKQRQMSSHLPSLHKGKQNKIWNKYVQILNQVFISAFTCVTKCPQHE